MQTAKEQLQAMLDDSKRVPEMTMGEMTTEPAPDERPRPLRIAKEDAS